MRYPAATVDRLLRLKRVFGPQASRPVRVEARMPQGDARRRDPAREPASSPSPSRPNPYRPSRARRPRPAPTPFPVRTGPRITPELRAFLRWLGDHWFLAAVLAFIAVRVFLRFRDRFESAEQGEETITLGLAGSAAPGSGGYDPLTRIAQLRLSVAANPDDAEARLELGKLLLESGRWREAITHLAEGARIAPADPRIRLALGRAYAAASSWDEALAHLDEAIRLDPRLAEARHARGDVLAEKHWRADGAIAAPASAAWADAARLYEAELERAPGDTGLRGQLADVLTAMGQRETALEHARLAAAQAPEDVGSQARLAALLEELGQQEAMVHYARAAAAQRRVVAANPRHVGQLVRLGELLNEVGEDGEADAWLDAALLDPECPWVEERLCEQGEQMTTFLEAAKDLAAGRMRAAVEGFRRAVADTPGIQAHAFCGLGEALAAQGEAGQARKAFRLALQARPRWWRPAEGLARLARGE